MEAVSPAGQMGEPSSRAAAILRIDLQGAAAEPEVLAVVTP